MKPIKHLAAFVIVFPIVLLMLAGFTVVLNLLMVFGAFVSPVKVWQRVGEFVK